MNWGSTAECCPVPKGIVQWSVTWPCISLFGNLRVPLLPGNQSSRASNVDSSNHSVPIVYWHFDVPLIVRPYSELNTWTDGFKNKRSGASLCVVRNTPGQWFTGFLAGRLTILHPDALGVRPRRPSDLTERSGCCLGEVAKSCEHLDEGSNRTKYRGFRGKFKIL